MKSEKIVNFCYNYSCGFDEVYRHETLKETLLGIAKILSYLLIIPPLVAGYLYFQNKRVTDLQREVDLHGCDAMQEIFKSRVLQGKQQDPQKVLIEYLVNKVSNFEATDNLELERSRFVKAFKKLDFDSQHKLFRQANENGGLALALKWIPSEITQLNFASGPLNPIQHANTNRQNMELFLKELPRFKNLTKIRLDFQGLGFYTPTVQRDVEVMAKSVGEVVISSGDPQSTFNHNGAEYYHHNATPQIIHSIVALRRLLQEFPQMEWEIAFSNLEAGGKGIQPSMLCLSEEGKGNFIHGGPLFDYLAKKIKA